MQPFENRSVRYWSREINGTRPGGRNFFFFISRGDDAPMVHGGRASLILSIPAREVSLGSPRVGTIHVHAPTPRTPPLQEFWSISLSSPQRNSRFCRGLASRALREH